MESIFSMTLDVQETCERYFLWEVATWSQPLERSAIESLQYNVCNFWLYWISVPGDWLHNEATIWENTVIQSCMKVEDPYCIATLSCPAFTRMYSIAQEMLMGYQDTKSSHRHLRALFLKASRRHPSTKATVGPWDRGKFESRSMQAYCRTSEHHMEPS